MTKEQIEAFEKITPGPWKWEDWTEDDGPNETTLTADPQYSPNYDPKGMFPDLRHRLFCYEDDELGENDKMAIAALPDLIAERREMIAALRSISESDPPSSACGDNPANCELECVGCIARAALAKAEGEQP